MNATLMLRRLKKWRSDKVLRWVKPSTYLYSISVWRRVNPRYDMSSGVGKGVDQNFNTINDLQFVSIYYARWHWTAVIYQGILGRDKWSDGLRQQVVTIIPPNNPRDIFGNVQAPAISPFDFDGYPHVKGFDSLGDIDRDADE